MASSQTAVQADPTSGPIAVVSIRAYNNQNASGAVFFEVEANSVCDTSVYMINLAWSGSKEVLATAMAAFMTGRKIKVEVAACTGWGSTVQSLYMVNQ